MRDNWLSNRVFKSYDDLVDHCREAWNKLVGQALADYVHRITPMGARVLISKTWYYFIGSRAIMAHPTVETKSDVFRLDFDRRLMRQPRGSIGTSDQSAPQGLHPQMEVQTPRRRRQPRGSQRPGLHLHPSAAKPVAQRPHQCHREPASGLAQDHQDHGCIPVRRGGDETALSRAQKHWGSLEACHRMARGLRSVRYHLLRSLTDYNPLMLNRHGSLIHN